MEKRILATGRKEETLDDIIKKSGKMSIEEAVELARQMGVLADGPIDEPFDINAKVDDEFLNAVLYGGLLLIHEPNNPLAQTFISTEELSRFRGMSFKELVENGAFDRNKNGAIYNPNNSYRQNGDAR